MAIAISSLCPVKTFTWRARDSSGKLTVRPLRIRAGHLFGGRHARKLWQQLTRMNEHFLGFTHLRGCFQLLKRVRLSQVEFAEGRSAQGF